MLKEIFLLKIYTSPFSYSALSAILYHKKNIKKIPKKGKRE